MKKTKDSMHLFLTLSLSMLFILSCCGASYHAAESNMTSNPSPQKANPVQIIIKFKDNVPDPSRDKFVQELSHTAQTSLSYLRPMSAGAHVFRVEDAHNTSQLGDILKRLAQRPDILYVELDSIVTYQNNIK